MMSVTISISYICKPNYCRSTLISLISVIQSLGYIVTFSSFRFSILLRIPVLESPVIGINLSKLPPTIVLRLYIY